jgi:hypothetical protein
MEIPWIGSGKGGNPTFISERVVSVIVDMAEGVLARWGRCHHCLGDIYILNLENCQENLIVKMLL